MKALKLLYQKFLHYETGTFQPVSTLGGISAHSDVSLSVAEGTRCNLNALSRASKPWGSFSTSALYRFVLTFKIVFYRLPSLFHCIALVRYCSFCLLCSSSVNKTVICACVCAACYASSKRIFTPVKELRRWTLVLCSLRLSVEKWKKKNISAWI